MCLIRNWSPKPWMASRSNALSLLRKHLRISVSIKGTPVNRSIAKFVSEATHLTSRARLMKMQSHAIAAARRDAGKSNAPTPGSIARDDF